jgi:hypothetical protein
MPTRRQMRKNRKQTKKNKSRKDYKKKSVKSKTQKWQTAFAAADKVLKKTQNLKKAREALKKKALENAEKIFGNVGRS